MGNIVNWSLWVNSLFCPVLKLVQLSELKMQSAGLNDDIIFPFPLRRAAYGLIERPNDFASYLLAIAICNLLLYFAFYIIMKVCTCIYVSKKHLD